MDVDIVIESYIIQGSLEVKLPTILTDEKQRWEESAKRREEERRSKKRKSQKKEDPDARQGTESRVFPMFCGSGGSKSRLAKAAGAEISGQLGRSKIARRRGAKHISKSKCTKQTRSGPLLEVEMSKKCTPLWREAHLEVKVYKTHQVGTTFGSWDVEKVHAVVARSTFRSQNVQTIPGPDHCWKLRCRKSAGRCGMKHGEKAKKISRSEHFWKLRCRKSARWCGAKHIRSQNVQNTAGPDHVWKSRCRKSARGCGAKHIVKKAKNTSRSESFWKLRCRKSARPCGAKHISKSKC